MGSITATATRKDLYNFISRINENCAPVTITNSRARAPSSSARTSGRHRGDAVPQQHPWDSRVHLGGRGGAPLRVRRRRRPGVVGCGTSNSPSRPPKTLRG